MRLQYPDLAAGAAYKALLLSDALQDEDDEYFDDVVDTLECCTRTGENKDTRCKIKPGPEDQQNSPAGSEENPVNISRDLEPGSTNTTRQAKIGDCLTEYMPTM